MWTQSPEKLQKEFVFKDFSEAFAFMTRVALLAETQQHHPSWHNIYNKVHIELTTHDAGNVVTDKDLLLAKSIDLLLGEMVAFIA